MARRRLEARLIRFVEKETGMRYRVKPKIVYTRNRKIKAPWQKRRHVVSYSNYVDAEHNGKRLKIKKAVVQALAVRGYVSAKGMKKPAPAVKPLIHELLENLYEQHHLKSLDDRHVKRVTSEAHRYALKMEGRLTEKYVKKYGVPE